MDQYAFKFQGDTIVLRASSAREACCRAFHEVAVSYDVDPDRLQQMGWPSDADFSAFETDSPVILEG